MSATNFRNSGKGKSAQEVFRNLKEEAQYYHGHGVYTGTIAEKSGFKMFTVPDGMSTAEFIDAVEDYEPGISEHVHPLVKKAWKIYDDKWGPAVCVKNGKNEYIFFGFVSE